MNLLVVYLVLVIAVNSGLGNLISGSVQLI